ncbi:MAG: hypothetical protein ACFFE4_18660 [Candidatus Thorarchaeota archaeon]
MSEEELKEQQIRDRINKIAQEIENIEESAKKKNIYIENKVATEFNPKIAEIGSKLQKEQASLEEIVSRIDELTLKKKMVLSVMKSLEQEYNDLIKTKEKTLSESLKAIAREKKVKTKNIDRNIKSLERELKSEKSK